MKNLTIIPQTKNLFTAAPINNTVKRRVAAYARVSTDHEEQQSSYEAQVDYYTRYIQNRGDWEFAGIYADEGISGCNLKKRDGFNRMVSDALAGKIDLIITKSVSRFARNTVDSLTTIRTLKEHGVEVFFEKESIWSFDSKGEILLTILSSLSQEESRSISENVTWGHRKRMADGKFSIAYSHFLGYDKGENGELVINEEEAKIIRRIYAMFLQGNSAYKIANQLTSDGIPTPTGKSKWNRTTVQGILSNEKYKGDALLQKTYTVDFLSKKTKVNRGEIQQYYIEEDHEAIIPPDVFDAVQREIAMRKVRGGRQSKVHIFSSKIKCGCCGNWYGSKVWHSTDKYRRVIWRCNHKYNNEKCKSPHFTEDEIKTAFIQSVNQLIKRKNEVIKAFESLINPIFDTAADEHDLLEMKNEMVIVTDLMRKSIDENARQPLDQNEYQKRYDDLARRYADAKERYEILSQTINDKKNRKAEIDKFLGILKLQKVLVYDFDESLWHGLVDFATVYAENDIRFTYKDGTEI